MLEKLVLDAIGRTAILRGLVREELKRLEAGGYLKPDDVERLSQETLTSLEARLAQARSVVGPLVQTLGRGLRDVFDLPSAAEVRALREELLRRGGVAPPGAPVPPGPAASPDAGAGGPPASPAG